MPTRFWSNATLWLLGNHSVQWLALRGQLSEGFIAVPEIIFRLPSLLPLLICCPNSVLDAVLKVRGISLKVSRHSFHPDFPAHPGNLRGSAARDPSSQCLQGPLNCLQSCNANVLHGPIGVLHRNPLSLGLNLVYPHPTLLLQEQEGLMVP